ncbi:hypothetical protein GRJ2_000519300 [Grus japonensis]|uniref:Uncharacterized protein n=1 Tax=Grus japonensis TaxID=30415 RepID=A0ABC9W644_GRUJA
MRQFRVLCHLAWCSGVRYLHLVQEVGKTPKGFTDGFEALVEMDPSLPKAGYAYTLPLQNSNPNDNSSSSFDFTKAKARNFRFTSK